MPRNYTGNAQRALSRAEEAAKRTRHGRVEPAHILLALLDLPESAACEVLARGKVNAGSLRQQVGASIPPATAGAFSGEVVFSPHALLVLEHAAELAQASMEEFIGTEHLLAGLLGVEGPAAILRENGVSRSACMGLIWEKIEARAPRVVYETSFEATGSRLKLRAGGEVEVNGFMPGGSMGSIMGRFNNVDDFEGYIASVKADWLESKGDIYGTRELRASLLEWLESRVLPELKGLL